MSEKRSLVIGEWENDFKVGIPTSEMVQAEVTGSINSAKSQETLQAAHILLSANPRHPLLTESNSQQTTVENLDTSHVGGGFKNAVFPMSLRCATGAIVATGSAFFLATIPCLAVMSARAGSVSWTSFFVAGFFVVLTVPISVASIVSHLTHWFAPDVQKYVVRILWMVPLYSLTSWSSLLVQPITVYTEPLRDLYEAYVISSFVYYMIALLGGEDALSETLERKAPSLGEHPWPLRIVLSPWNMGEEFMVQCKTGTLQFIVVKTITTVIYVVLTPLGLYSEGSFSLRSVFTYVSLILSASMGWAMYCLVKLFVATKEELRSPKDWGPVGKFLCIKGVVFFTWWQGFLFLILRNVGIIGPIGDWDAQHVAKALQDLAVCVEMLAFAIAHNFTFSYRDYLLDITSETMSSVPYRELSPMSIRENFDHRSESLDADAVTGAPPGPFKISILGPSIRQVSAPMSVKQAIWSSTVPNETISDIARLSWGVSSQSSLDRSKAWGGGGEIQFYAAEGI